MNRAIITAAAISCLPAAGCAEPATRQPWAATTQPEAATGPRQAVSLLGRPLHPMPLAPEVRAEREANLAEARVAWELDPRDEEAIIWLGRRQAYLGRYDLAIDTFTNGLSVHPDSFKLLRHRGHRFISVRRLDAAVADLARAAALVVGVPDEVEPDGLPNALNQPRSTNHTNIYYHLGLARYLRGEFDAAVRAYERCLGLCTNDDMAVATRYWLHLTLRRLGRDDDAAAVLAPVRREMDVIENDGYHELLLLFKGELSPEEVLGREEGDAIQSSTRGYGVARWHLDRGDTARGRELLQRIVEGEAWPAFGFIAAEADLARMPG